MVQCTYATWTAVKLACDVSSTRLLPQNMEGSINLGDEHALASRRAASRLGEHFKST